jgi:hypothetical protein
MLRYPLPGYGDVKRRLIFSCVYGIGMNPGAPRKKAVMLLGPARNGKSFLADAVAGELSTDIFRLHPLQFLGGLTSGRRPVVKIIAESLSQRDEKHVVSTPLSGIRVGGRHTNH